MKKLSMLLCAFALAAILTPAGTSAAAEPMVVRIAHAQPIDSPEDIGFKAFAAKLVELSKGSIKAEVYPAMQLGDVLQVFESVQLGVIQVSGAATPLMAPFCDDAKILDLPYMLASDIDAIDHVLNNTPEGKELLGRLRNSGFEGGGFWCMGTRLMSTKNTQVKSVADMRGIKFRIMESPMLNDIYKSWGALPVPIAYSELYNALQQGVVDGQENPIQSIYLMNMHEVQKYIFAPFHATMTWAFFYNKGWHDALTPEQQGWLKEAEAFGRSTAIKTLRSLQEQYTRAIVDYGCTYYEFTPAQIDEFKAASRPVWDKHLTTAWQKDFAPRLQQSFANYKK